MTPSVDDLLQDVRILVVDDSAAICSALRKFLEPGGAVVTTCGSAEEALLLAEAEHPDAYLLDVVLPDMDGLTLCKELRQRPWAKHCPIVLITSLEDIYYHLSALEGGADDFIQKPIHPLILRARLASHLARHAAEREVTRLLGELQRFVAQPVREQVDHQGDAERIEATVLFTDLRGFTRDSLRHEPDAFFQAVSQVLAQQSEIIRQHGGYIDKFAGDGLMAVFAKEGHVDSACESAMEIISWCRRTEMPGLWKEIPLASGLHSGPVLRGIMGSENRRDYTVMGHVVNTAARVCGAANLHEVLVTDAVVASLGSDLPCGPNREEPLKGINVPVRVRSLLVRPPTES